MTAQVDPPGYRLGLPPSGPGSLAPFGRRLAAFAIDAAAAALIAALFVGGAPGQWSLIPFALDYLFGLPLAGRSFGMSLTGLRVIRVDAAKPVDPGRALLRTALLALLVPALIRDGDQRGLHDRLTGTAVIVH